MGFAEGVPTVQIQLGGKSYTLGWTWAAKRRVRDYLAARHGDPLKANEEENLATVLWASMDKEQRESLTVEDVEEMVHPDNERIIAEKIRDLCLRSEPDPNVDPVAVKKPTTGESNSKKSGQLVSTT